MRGRSRDTWVVGGVLIVASALLVVVSHLFGLELEPVSLAGLALGAVLALVPDQPPIGRVVAFALGLVAAWIGFLLRAAVLPDSVGGRVVGLGVVMVVCVLVAGLSGNRAPLWAALLGAAALGATYEAAYTAAPPEVLATSTTALTSLLLTCGVGFLVASAVARPPAPAAPAPSARPHRGDDAPSDKLDEMMETSK